MNYDSVVQRLKQLEELDPSLKHTEFPGGYRLNEVLSYEHLEFVERSLGNQLPAEYRVSC